MNEIFHNTEQGNLFGNPPVKLPSALIDIETNPLIQKLPQLTGAAILDSLESRIHHIPDAESLASMNLQERELLIRLVLTDFYHPSAQFVDLTRRLLSMIARGYSTKSMKYYSGHEGSHRNSIPNLLVLSHPQNGVTCTLERALYAIPQRVEHLEHQSTQVCYVRLDATSCYTPQSFYKAIIRQFATVLQCRQTEKSLHLLGDRKLKDHARGLIKSNLLGMVVIDGINFIDKRQFINKVMPAVTELLNECKVPLVLAGRASALEHLLSNNDQLGNNANFDVYLWNPLKLEWNGQRQLKAASLGNWHNFTSDLWEKQLLSEKESFTEEKSLKLLELSGGLMGLTSRIFTETLVTAMYARKQETSVKMFEVVADKLVKHLKPMTTAIHSNDIELMAKYDDLMMPGMEELLIEFRKTKARKRNLSYFSAPRAEHKALLFNMLTQSSIGKNLARKAVLAIFLEHPDMVISDMVTAAKEWIFSMDSKPAKNTGRNANRRKELTQEENEELDELLHSTWCMDMMREQQFLE